MTYDNEREQIEREMAEREARIKRDEMLEWAASRTAARTATKGHRPAPAAAPATLTREWQAYITARIDAASQSSMRAMTRAIAQTIGKDIVALERRCEKLEVELAELKDRFDQERGKRMIRAVPDRTP